MTTLTIITEQQLTGDWTISGVLGQVDSLSHSLLQLASEGKKLVYIDCGKIDAIDLCGLQLLHVWMECASMQGIQAKLINLPGDMHQSIQRLGLDQCFTDRYPDEA